jgi:hypothetical protein
MFNLSHGIGGHLAHILASTLPLWCLIESFLLKFLHCSHLHLLGRGNGRCGVAVLHVLDLDGPRCLLRRQPRHFISK